MPEPSRHELVLPDLGAGEMPVVVSLWLVNVGSEVTEGDRLLEVLMGSVSIDLPAPASGILVETLVSDDDPVRAGQVLGIIASARDEREGTES